MELPGACSSRDPPKPPRVSTPACTAVSGRARFASLQRGLAAKSDRGRYEQVPCGHLIAESRPDVVARAIRELIAPPKPPAPRRKP